ncbi:Ref family recombination enhancement nuclease [Paenalcaligenes hominis]|uniref:Ref family recombination enhancement nuclease n=1 Tax=Paenalcaligenes hominis TaxID=643674 RepID=UPI003525E4DE
MTKTERKHLSQVAEQGCILCRYLGYGPTPAEIHHLRHGMGMAQRNSNYNVIPLCPEHHRGATGFHGLGRRAFERTYGVTELDLLAMSQKNSSVTAVTVPSLQSHNF